MKCLRPVAEGGSTAALQLSLRHTHVVGHAGHDPRPGGELQLPGNGCGRGIRCLGDPLLNRGGQRHLGLVGQRYTLRQLLGDPSPQLAQRHPLVA